jgi:hypothetical protein
MDGAERKRDEEMNALLDDLDELWSWADSFCAEDDFVKEALPCGLICESSELSSATTPGEVADLGIREEQRELQGLKSKSGGTEILTPAAIKIPKWESPEDGWEAWEPPATTLEAGAHRMLACWASGHTRVHQRCIRSWVTKDRWCHSPYMTNQRSAIWV